MLHQKAGQYDVNIDGLMLYAILREVENHGDEWRNLTMQASINIAVLAARSAMWRFERAGASDLWRRRSVHPQISYATTNVPKAMDSSATEIIPAVRVDRAV